MDSRSTRALALVAVLTAPPATAGAQGFIGGGVIADDDRTNSSLTESVAASWTLVAGIDVTRHVGLRGVLDAPRQVRTVAEGETSGLYRPLERYHVTRTRRSMTYGLLVDLHGDVTPRIRFAAVGGVVRVTHDSESIVVREALHEDGSTSPLPELRDIGDHDWTGLGFGVEVPLRLTSRLDIVPELRTIYFILSDSPEPYIIRTGAGLRWRF